MLQGHSSSVLCVAFSPDGKYLASGSYDKTAKLWNVESQKEVNTLQGHIYAIFSVAFSPDGKYLASGSEDNTVKLWSVESLSKTIKLKDNSHSDTTSILYTNNNNNLTCDNNKILTKK